MATTLIKDKLSKLVPSQLPEYVRNDFQTFIAFATAYYQFLEQDQGAQELLQNIFNYNDIDNTIDSFIEYFKNYYTPYTPDLPYIDDRALVKNIKNFYSNKGDEKSFILLLQLLLNKSAEFDYPGKYVLIASDGKWKQEVSVFVKILIGDSDLPLGKNMRVVADGIFKDNIVVKKKNPVIETVGSVDFLSTDKFEYIFDDVNKASIAVGDLIETTGFVGEIIATTTELNIIDGGSNFKVGQTFRLLNGNGNRSVIRIVEVDSDGGIVRLEYIQYGLGYESDFLTSVTPGVAAVGKSVFSVGGPSSNILTIGDVTEGFIDKGSINIYNYTEISESGGPAFIPSYCGDIIRSFLNDTRIIVSATGDPATIEVRRGAKTKYPGYYVSNDGFLSDGIYLQDQDFYQPYSYQIKIDEQLSVYKKALLDVLHPAGTKMFGNYIISKDKNLTPSLSTTISIE